MENTSQEKSNEDQNWINKKQALLDDEFSISEEERRRLAEFFPIEGSTRKMWIEFALKMRICLMDDYRDGQIDLLEMLEIMRKCSLVLCTDRRLFFMGSIAEFGLKTPQKSKDRGNGQRNPPNPRWLKRVIVEFFDSVSEIYPNMNDFPNRNDDESIYKVVTDFLRPLQISSAIAERTIERWLGEPENKNLQSYRLSRANRPPNI